MQVLFRHWAGGGRMGKQQAVPYQIESIAWQCLNFCLLVVQGLMVSYYLASLFLGADPRAMEELLMTPHPPLPLWPIL